MNEAIRQWVAEAGGSLDDKVQRVRSAFHAWYNEGLSWERMAWVLDVFDEYLMVQAGRKTFRVDFTDSDDTITFAETPWPMYELQYVPAETSAETTEVVRETVRLTVQLAEAAQDDAGLFPGSVIVAEGLSANNNEYTAAALKTGKTIFEGAKLVADHELEEGERARPEGSVHDVIGKVTTIRLGERDGKSVLLGDVFISESETKIRTKVKEGILGDLSIRAWGQGTRADDGHFVVESFQPHPYTNIAMVTVGAAGGQLVSEADPGQSLDALLQTITREDLARVRPDLVQTPVAESDGTTEIRQLRESEQMDLKQQLEAVQRERDTLLDETTRLFKTTRTHEGESRLADALTEAGALPEPVTARIRTAAAPLITAYATHGSEQTDEQLAEALTGIITAEKAYLAQIVPNGQVTSLTARDSSDAATTEALEEAFAALPGMTPDKAKAAARGRQAVQ